MPPKQKNQKKSALRGATAQQINAAVQAAVRQEKQKQKQSKTKNRNMTTSVAPVSIGTTVTSSAPVRSAGGANSLVMRGRDFLVSLPETNQTNWYLSAAVPINPIYWGSTPVGRAAAVYTKFRFKKLIFHFVTRQPTSSAGEILLCHNTNISVESLASTGSDFLAKAMSFPSSLMGPVWTNHSLACTTSAAWKNVDALSGGDVDDNIPGELLAYVQSGITDTVGYLFVEYEVEFREINYTERTISFPLSSGFAEGTWTDTPAPVVGVPMITNGPGAAWFSGNTNPFTAGAVFKVILNYTGTTLGTPQNSTNALYVVTKTGTTTFSVADGTTFYVVLTANNVFAWYPTLESALVMSDTIYVAYRTAGTASAWRANYYLVQSGAAFRM